MNTKLRLLVFVLAFNILNDVLGDETVHPTVRLEQMRDAFAKGDFSPLVKCAEAKDLDFLWYVCTQVNFRRYSPTINREIPAKAKALLSSIPGHTENVITRIEQKAESTKGIYGPDGEADGRLGKIAETEEELRVLDTLREKAMTNVDMEFIELKQLGSPECMQTLMTFLDDERRIGGSFSQFGFQPGSTNQWLAIKALSGILGDENPATEEFDTRGKPFNVPAMVRRFKDWWLSDASKKWRTPVVNTTRSHLLPGGSKGPETVAAPAWAFETFQRDALWPILLILCLATLAAVLGFSKLRRG